MGETLLKKEHVFSAYISKVNDAPMTIIRKGLDFINWKRFVKKDSTIFIKPNLTYPRYKKGVTTNPEILRCLLKIIKDRCDRIILGESDGGNRSFTAEESFKGHNLYRIAKEIGVELVNLSKLPSKFVESKIQLKRVKVQLPKMLLDDVDCLISVPVLKVHVMTGVTLGLKNLWGCHPDTMRCLQHQNLDRKLALIAKILEPRIIVTDGSFALNGHGPIWGTTVKTNLILLSDNIVVSDALGAKLMGIHLKNASHILMAEKEGLGTTNMDEIRINTDWNQYVMQFYIKKTLIDRLSRLLFCRDKIAELVFDSPITPGLYKLIDLIRTDEEKIAVNNMNKFYGA